MPKHVYIAAAAGIAVILAACAEPPAASTAAPTLPAATSAARIATVAPPTALAPTAAPPTQAPPTNAPPTAAPTAAAGAAGAPRFTHPIDITNPFYPVALTAKTIALGQEGGRPSRNEVTLLPDTKQITWAGQTIEARVTQFVAYTDGKLIEIAYDYFAQADDGGVYYLGEDVSNYENGALVDHEGSWLAGQNGAPAALIMPAHPAVGAIFNPENLPGVVFESDEVISLTQPATTPAGPTDQGILIKETLMDGSIEHKVYAAGFGIIEERADDEQVDLVLHSRSDAKPGMVPAPVATLEAQAEDIIDIVPSGNWANVASDVATISAAWDAYRAQVAADRVPQPFQDATAAAIARLQKTSAAKQIASTLQAANDLSAAVVDLFVVYHPALPADVGQLDVLERQVVLDVTAKDFRAALDSLAKVGAAWVRLKPLALAHSGADASARFEASLAAQQKALDAKDAAALTGAATNGLALIDILEQLF